jgi:hypothetical protein
MGSDLNQEPRAVADASGFPLQIGVMQAIDRSGEWRVAFQEHPWRSDETGSEGFIDIVAMKRHPGFGAVVIECKRVRQSAWVFLIPKTSPSVRSHATVWDSRRGDGRWVNFGWNTWQADPSTYESLYCAIPGQEQGRRNLLERTASDLVQSVEALARQELELVEHRGTLDFSRVYAPVLVTTARLFVASFDPATVTLQDGALPKDVSFVEVPHIRFRKGLSVLSSSPAGDLRELNKAMERTVFVVHAESVTSFLNQLEFG